MGATPRGQKRRRKPFKCENRHLWFGKTCRQAHRSYFENWCIPCCIRFDHECGEHGPGGEDGCQLCEEEKRGES